MATINPGIGSLNTSGPLRMPSQTPPAVADTPQALPTDGLNVDFSNAQAKPAQQTHSEDLSGNRDFPLSDGAAKAPPPLGGVERAAAEGGFTLSHTGGLAQFETPVALEESKTSPPLSRDGIAQYAIDRMAEVAPLGYGWSDTADMNLDMVSKEVSQMQADLEAVACSTRLQLQSFEGGYTQQHMQRAGVFAQDLAKALDGTARALTPEQKNALELASTVYDVGKLAVPEEYWLTPGKPTAEQWTSMQSHVNVGVTDRSGCAATEAVFESFGQADLPSVRAIARNHHERWDGNGYPDKLKGDDIPIGAQLIGIGDMYDSLISERPFRPAKSTAVARQMMEESAQKGQFNPELVKVFLAQVVAPPGQLSRSSGPSVD